MPGRPCAAPPTAERICSVRGLPYQTERWSVRHLDFSNLFAGALAQDAKALCNTNEHCRVVRPRPTVTGCQNMQLQGTKCALSGGITQEWHSYLATSERPDAVGHPPPPRTARHQHPHPHPPPPTSHLPPAWAGLPGGPGMGPRWGTGAHLHVHRTAFLVSDN